jgi:hypothetical protein
MKKLYFLITILATSLSFGQAFTATYDFASVVSGAGGMTDPTPVPTVTGITFGSFTAANPDTSLSLNSTGAGRFSFDHQPLGATNADNVYANLTGAIDLGTYYQVTITPNTNFSINLSQITFRAQRSGTGVRTYAVRSSVDGYAANLAATVTPTIPELSVEASNTYFFTTDVSGGYNGSTITLAGFSNITAPVTLRFYGWNAEGTGGTFSIDDVAITGTVNTLGVNQNSIAGLQVYPNPVTNGNLYITSDSNDTKTIAIYDVLGKVVTKASVTDQPVNVSNLKGGVYIVKITEAGKTATRKLVIK